MSGVSIAERVLQDPTQANLAFDRVEEALNTLLPGSQTHPRYQASEEVGLAMVIARDAPGPVLDPFDPETLTHLDFRRDNQAEHPAAWAPTPLHVELLGDEIDPEIGVFTTFAVAKIVRMSGTPALGSSHSVFGPNLGRGVVGLAGGIRNGESLLAASGLWEVHDHLAIRVVEHELQAPDPDSMSSTDEIAAKLKKMIGEVARIHQGVPAEDLTRLDQGRVVQQFNKG